MRSEYFFQILGTAGAVIWLFGETAERESLANYGVNLFAIAALGLLTLIALGAAAAKP